MKTEVHQSLHELFQSLTGWPMRWNTNLDCIWAAWVRAGFTEADLRLVVAYIKANMKPKGYFSPASLGFYKLVSDPILFGDRLAEARTAQNAKKAAARSWHDPAKAQVLRDMGRAQASAEPKPVGDVVGRTPEQWQAFFDKCKSDAGLTRNENSTPAPSGGAAPDGGH